MVFILFSFSVRFPSIALLLNKASLKGLVSYPFHLSSVFFISLSLLLVFLILVRVFRPFARLWWDETVATVLTYPTCHSQVQLFSLYLCVDFNNLPCNSHLDLLQAALHPEQDRLLTVREYARLQGFPDSYKFFGTVKERCVSFLHSVLNKNKQINKVIYRFPFSFISSVLDNNPTLFIICIFIYLLNVNIITELKW